MYNYPVCIFHLLFSFFRTLYCREIEQGSLYTGKTKNDRRYNCLRSFASTS